MKNNIKFMALGALALAMTGCNFFDSSSPSSSSIEETFSSATNTRMAMTAVYEGFNEDRFYRNRLSGGFWGQNSDIEWGRDKEYNKYTINPQNTDVSNSNGKDAWGFFQIQIERCNNIIAGIEKYGFSKYEMGELRPTDSLTYRFTYGEAHFMRGFCLLEMVKMWGDIPVNTQAFDGTNNTDICHVKQDRNVAFEQARSDFKTAMKYLQWSEQAELTAAVNDVRYPSRGAAMAMLMRTDLYYAGKGVHPDASVTTYGPGDLKAQNYNVRYNCSPERRDSLFNEIVAVGTELIGHDAAKLTVQGSFEKVFRDICSDVTRYGQMEHLWVIPMANGARGQVLCGNAAKFTSDNSTTTVVDPVTGAKSQQESKVGNYIFGILKNNVDYGDVSSNGGVFISPLLFFDYEEGDTRRDVTVCPWTWATEFSNSSRVKDASGNTMNKVWADSPEAKLHGPDSIPYLYQKVQSNVASWYCGKYRIEWMAHENRSTDDGVDWPVIRMADVYLMAAEAKIMLGQNGDAEINAVRQRAGVEDVSGATLETIQKERAFEFAGEMLRKNDLMRWGILRERLEAVHTEIQNEWVAKKNNQYAQFYVRFREDNEFLQQGATLKDKTFPVNHAFVIESIRRVPNATSSDKTQTGEIQCKCAFADKLDERVWFLYDYEHPEYIEAHQYWPIFSSVVGAAGSGDQALLWNNYGY